MLYYTPGLHLFSALLGAWLHTDWLRVIYPFVALTVALKAGVVALIAYRLVPVRVPRVPLAIAAVLFLWIPARYFIESFASASYLAQVVSEFFAVVMLWSVVVWADDVRVEAAIAFAIAAVGAFLVWPLWVGPLVLTLIATVTLRDDVPANDRLQSIAVATIPLAIIAGTYVIGRTAAVTIVTASGYVPYPTVASFGRSFLVGGAAGVVVVAGTRRTRVVFWLVIATALQAALLYVLAMRSGADRPYQALKMAYLVIYPLAIGGALVLAAVCRSAGRAVRPVAWAMTAAVAIGAGRSVYTMPRPKPALTIPLDEAGRWTRTHLPIDCIDYLVADDYAAYWLHHAVLRNPRFGGRPHSEDLFDTRKAVERWILPNGRPYAIVQDVEMLPRDIRNNVDVLARFGPAAVVRRRGPSSCQ